MVGNNPFLPQSMSDVGVGLVPNSQQLQMGEKTLSSNEGEEYRNRQAPTTAATQQQMLSTSGSNG